MPDAPATTDSSEPPGNRFRKPSLSQVVVAILIGSLAFAITLQVRQSKTTSYTGVRGDQLVELLKSLDSANERIDTQIDDLTATRSDLLSSTRRSAQAEKQAKKRSEELSILAGTAGATGRGVALTIADPDKAIDAAALLDAVQELRDSGAEAIAINGVARVVAQTYFLDGDNAIRVGGRDLKRPFVIEAIGDPATMAGALGIRGGLIERVANRGATATVAELQKITITALADVKTPEYARPTS